MFGVFLLLVGFAVGRDLVHGVFVCGFGAALGACDGSVCAIASVRDLIFGFFYKGSPV